MMKWNTETASEGIHPPSATIHSAIKSVLQKTALYIHVCRRFNAFVKGISLRIPSCKSLLILKQLDYVVIFAKNVI